MRAAVVTRYAGPDVIEVREVPEPQEDGAALVQVAATPVIDLDTKLRAGWGHEFGLTPPYVPGGSVIGTLLQDLPAHGIPAGTRVGALTTTQTTGAAAHQATVRPDSITAIPDGLTDEVAAALLLDGVTAVALLAATTVTTHDRVLILGAAGGAARLLAQAARSAGAQVVGTARGSHKGADVLTNTGSPAIDHSADAWIASAREALEGHATVVYDGVGAALGRSALLELTTSGTRFSAHGAASGDFSIQPGDRSIPPGVTVTGIEIPQRAVLNYQATLKSAFERALRGEFRPKIARLGRLDELADVHRAIEARELVGAAIITP